MRCHQTSSWIIVSLDVKGQPWRAVPPLCSAKPCFMIYHPVLLLIATVLFPVRYLFKTHFVKLVLFEKYEDEMCQFSMLRKYIGPPTPFLIPHVSYPILRLTTRAGVFLGPFLLMSHKDIKFIYYYFLFLFLFLPCPFRRERRAYAVVWSQVSRRAELSVVLYGAFLFLDICWWQSVDIFWETFQCMKLLIPMVTHLLRCANR